VAVPIPGTGVILENKMNHDLFKLVAQKLLETHYGISLDDTHLGSPVVIDHCIDEGTRPYQAVSDHAEDCSLERRDKSGFYGTPSYALLSPADELAALESVVPVLELSDQPTTCPKCASRTDFNELDDGRQHHACGGCAHEFITNDAAFCVRPDPLVAEILDDRYADAIIGDRVADYDALEIQGVRNLNALDDPAGTCCEVDNENPQFFSVYAHLRQDGQKGGVECVGDFANYASANSYAWELAEQYQWPVRDYVDQRFKQPAAA
jgi:hypothetical protein